ncbi:hypothetical protein RHORCCE3_0882 [Rickettsia hoogstraalii str. RCCE3]|nr:hypothetical protein RHORCCE3_0882 [Rickettsia hoogstraalii str. RCCE3]
MVEETRIVNIISSNHDEPRPIYDVTTSLRSSGYNYGMRGAGSLSFTEFF